MTREKLSLLAEFLAASGGGGGFGKSTSLWRRLEHSQNRKRDAATEAILVVSSINIVNRYMQVQARRVIWHRSVEQGEMKSNHDATIAQ